VINTEDFFFFRAEAKQSLQALIQEVRDTIADQEKIQGKLTKEEKVIHNSYP